jgi:hypothetical protein
MVLFDDVTEAIAHAYSTLGHELGWRFLYTPARTLAPGAPLLFAGLNPGGHADLGHPQLSVETGNAYRVETWGDNGQLNPLQLQVCALYDRLAEHLPVWDRDSLMDASLSANFCPFRSPSWAALPRKRESVAFSQSLWSRVLNTTLPPALICLTELPAQYIAGALQKLKWSVAEEQVIKVGWGSVTCSIRTLRRMGDETVLVRLPHLSRYRIIGRPESEAAVEHVVRALARAIRRRLA